MFPSVRKKYSLISSRQQQSRVEILHNFISQLAGDGDEHLLLQAYLARYSPGSQNSAIFEEIRTTINNYASDDNRGGSSRINEDLVNFTKLVAHGHSHTEFCI